MKNQIQTQTGLYRAVLMAFFLLTISLSVAQGVKFQWGESSDAVSLSDMVSDGVGNIYCTGKFWSTVDFDYGSGVHNITPSGASMYFQKIDGGGNYVSATYIEGDLYSFGIALDPSGNVLITGQFTGTIDFDPGPGVFNLTSTGAYFDPFVLKLDNNGNFIWAKSFKVNEGAGADVTTDALGNVYTAGKFIDTADFDPGPSTYQLITSGSSYNAYVSKLSANGDFVWAHAFGNTNSSYADDMALNSSGQLTIIGVFNNTVDFDPGPGTFNLTSSGGQDDFILRLDSSGNLVWAKAMTGSVGATACAIDGSGNLFIAGGYNGTVDFDLGSGVNNLSSPGLGYDSYVLKMDGNGDFVWVRATSSHTSSNETQQMIVDNAGNPIVVGHIGGTSDMDPGPDTFLLSAVAGSDGFVLKLNAIGDFVWAGLIGGPGYDDADNVVVDAWDNVYINGEFYQSVDVDPGGLSHTLLAPMSPKIYMTKWSDGACAGMELVVDSVQDITCVDSGYAYVHVVNGISPFTYSLQTVPQGMDSSFAFSSSGFYSLIASDSAKCYTSKTIRVNGPSSMTGFDLNSNLITTDFRPGFAAPALLDVFNEGCMPVSGQVRVILDTLVTFDSASIAPNTINGDTLIWTFNNLDFTSISLKPKLYLHTKTTATIGNYICFDIAVTPSAADLDTNNNFKKYCYSVINGYDPNDKQVYPQGSCFNNYVIKGEILTYSIRFQNTGNASAINVEIIDSLQSELDMTTINVLESSHTMYTELIGGNVVKFVFNDIQLPDSTSDEPGSHGYVVFEIAPINGLPNGTLVRNNSGIYFDFNPVVVTNTTMNTLIDIIPADHQTQQLTACDSLQWQNGVTYTTSNNTAIDPYFNAMGCDSIIHLDLTINYSSAGIDVQKACDAFQWIDGITYTSSTVSPVYILTNQAGCDSVVTLNLTIDTVDTEVLVSGAEISASMNGDAYQWLDCNDRFAIISGATSQTYTATSNGSYAVEVTQINCVDTSACIEVIIGGLAVQSLQDMSSFYPNPADAFIIFRSSASIEKISAQLLDRQGRVMENGQWRMENDHSFKLDVSALENGIYLLKVIADGQIYTEKVLIRH